MKRRLALQALLAIPAARAQEIAGIAVTAPDAVGTAKLHFFTKPEMDKLRALADQIVPAFNGRPGAVEVGASEFLDFLLSKSLASDQRVYRQGLAAVHDLEPLLRPARYREPSDPAALFLRRFKDDLLRATTNSRGWIEASGRRGGGVNYFWKPIV